MGKVKVVNRVDMLSFTITSEEEDTEKVDADSHSDSSVTFLGILISCMSDVAFYYLRLDRYSIIVGMFWLHVRCHT